MVTTRVCLEHFKLEQCDGKRGPGSNYHRNPRSCRWSTDPRHIGMVERYRRDFPDGVLP